MKNEAIAEKIFTYIIEQPDNKILLNDDQKIKLRQACINAVNDNPDSNMNDLLKAVSIYLRLIINFPTLTL